MLYDHIFVDVFNVYHRLKSKSTDIFVRASNVIDYIEDMNCHLQKDGDLYLLFDPIPKTDLGEKACFRNSVTERQLIDRDYKSNRLKDPIDISVISLIYKYFEYRGEKYKSVKNSYSEADDFVESLIESLPNSKIALITTDLDWSKYISENVYFINESWDRPMTKEDFKDKYGYYPSILFLTLYKAIFGDGSDNIKSLFTIKRVFYYSDLKKAVFNFFDNLDNSETVKSFVRRFFEYTSSDCFLKEGRNAEEELFLILSTADSRYGEPINIFKSNIALIRSRCKNATKYVSWKKENSKINKAIDASLGRNVNLDNNSKKFKFGGVKLV